MRIREDTDHDQVFVVRVRTYGDPSRTRSQIAAELGQMLHLGYGNRASIDGYDYDPNAPFGQGLTELPPSPN